MNAAFEFHDSVIHETLVHGGNVRVIFSEAYVHRSEGRPGWDKGTGWIQAVELTFSEVEIKGSIPDCPGVLFGGSLIVRGDTVGLVPVPFQYGGHVRAELIFADGAMVSLDANGVRCVATGEARFVEKFPG